MTTGRVSSSSGETSTPPGAGRMRTSRPPIARCSSPSTSLFARSVPKTRKRRVDNSKSNGSGKRSSDIAERVEAFELHPLLLEVVREAGSREDAVRCERRATVRPAVADEDERVSIRQRPALALVAADLADALVAEDHAPPVRPHLGVVRAHLDVYAFALEHGQDQLRQPARHDHRVVPIDELMEAGAHLDVL